MNSNSAFVPAPKIGDQNNFLCTDGTWKEPNQTDYFLCSNGIWTKGNEQDKFLRGNGNWSNMFFKKDYVSFLIAAEVYDSFTAVSILTGSEDYLLDMKNIFNNSVLVGYNYNNTESIFRQLRNIVTPMYIGTDKQIMNLPPCSDFLFDGENTGFGTDILKTILPYLNFDFVNSLNYTFQNLTGIDFSILNNIDISNIKQHEGTFRNCNGCVLPMWVDDTWM